MSPLAKRNRKAISGVVAALIMFVMLFTVGTGYFLWVSYNNFTLSQAQVSRNNANVAQSSEDLFLVPSVQLPLVPTLSHINVVVSNSGNIPIVLNTILVTDMTDTVLGNPCSATCKIGVNPGGVTQPIYTGYNYQGRSVRIKLITQSGSVFSTTYMSPALSTVLSSATIPAGVPVYDAASFATGTLFGSAGGTVTYHFSTSASCATGPSTQVGLPVNVLNGNIPNSAGQAFGTPGTYYWYAEYSGDSNDAPATSPCETLTVGAASGVTISTQLSSLVVGTGAPLYDTAALAGQTSNAGGTVTYRWFSGGACAGAGTVVGNPAVVNGLVPNSPSVQYVVSGSYSWTATYSGDPNNNPATSTCEPLTVVTNNGGGGATGSLTQVVGSFRFYFTNCNAVAGQDCRAGVGNGLGDGVRANGYYGYGLSFTGASDCDGDDSTCSTDVFQITLTNQDPQGRSITLSSQSFLSLSGVCLSEGVCGGEGDFGATFNQGYWIVDGICSPASTCTGFGAVPTPYSTAVTVGPGATVTLYFYCGTPCTTSTDVQPPGNNPAPGTYLSVSLNLYGLYSDGTPFGQDIPFISSYVSPVQIVGCSEVPGPNCWAAFNPAEQLTGSPGSQITLSVDGFAAQPTNPFPVYVYWVNPSGTTSIVNGPTTCDVNNQPCRVTFTIPSGEATGYYGLYVTSDGVNNAYATVSVLGTTGIITSLSQTTIVAGGTVFDSATLAGVTANAGGQVSYSYFAGSSCQGSATVVSTVTVNNGLVPNSAAQKFVNAGPFSWDAVYTGDGNNNGATSTCEQMTVQPASPAISTSLSKSTVSVGQAVYDSATLSGATTNAGGTVTYEFFANIACGGTPTAVATVTVNNGNVPSSGNYFPNAVGTYYFVAAYSGDPNNNPATSSCTAEPLTATIGSPTLSTSLMPNNVVAIGTSVSDSATLAGASSTAGGTVTYNYFGGSACSGTGTTVSTVTVNNGVVPNSAGVPFNTVGSYSWRATYSGDSNDNSAQSACESLTVNKASPTITTTVSPGTITIGAGATDSGTFSNGFGMLTGTLVFQAYSSPSCGGSASFTSTTITVNGNGPYTSNAFSPTTVRTYYWQVTFADTDGNNNGFTSSCGGSGETLAVAKASPTVSTTLSAASIGAGGSVHDSATLTGATSSAGGTVTYYFYTGSACNSGQSQVGPPVTVTNGVVPNSISRQFNVPGSYSWNAVYSGDTNNNGATSSCEALTVTTPTAPTVTDSGSPNYLVTFSGGSGYAPSTQYSYCLSSSTTSTSQCVGSTQGTFVSTVTGTVPNTFFNVPPGDRTGTWYLLIYEGNTVIVEVTVPGI